LQPDNLQQLRLCLHLEPLAPSRRRSPLSTTASLECIASSALPTRLAPPQQPWPRQKPTSSGPRRTATPTSRPSRRTTHPTASSPSPTTRCVRPSSSSSVALCPACVPATDFGPCAQTATAWTRSARSSPRARSRSVRSRSRSGSSGSTLDTTRSGASPPLLLLLRQCREHRTEERPRRPQEVPRRHAPRAPVEHDQRARPPRPARQVPPQVVPGLVRPHSLPERLPQDPRS